MGTRTTIYNYITSPEKIASINKKNLELVKDFLSYLASVGRANTTIKSYRADLNIFFCWNLENLDNKYFVELTKREISKFQNHALNEWGWSTNRLRTVKAALSSLSNFIENILDDEIEGYRGIIKRVETPPKAPAREKTILSEEDVDKLLSMFLESGDIEKACLFALAAFSGRRKSELARFRLSDVSEDNLVCGGALYKTAPIRTKGRGVKGKQLTCYVLAKKFRPYLSLWIEYRKEKGIDSEWLFPQKGNHKEQIKISTLDSWANTASTLLGTSVYLHSFRHHFTTFLSKAGLPDAVITNLIGWESSAMVKIYNDIEADEQIGQYFSEDGEIVADKQKKLAEI